MTKNNKPLKTTLKSNLLESIKKGTSNKIYTKNLDELKHVSFVNVN